MRDTRRHTADCKDRAPKVFGHIHCKCDDERITIVRIATNKQSQIFFGFDVVTVIIVFGKVKLDPETFFATGATMCLGSSIWFSYSLCRNYKVFVSKYISKCTRIRVYRAEKKSVFEDHKTLRMRCP